MTTPKRRPRFTFTVGTAEARAESSTMTTEQFEAARERAGIRGPRERPMSEDGMTGNDVRATLRAIILDHFNPPDDKHPTWWINPDVMADAILGKVGPTLLRQGWEEGAESAFYAPTVRGQVDYPANPYRSAS